MFEKAAAGEIPPGYEALRYELEQAFAQAACGKGRERHANNRHFEEQPILKICQLAGDGFAVGQVMKKLQEAQGMVARGEGEAALREVHGAIVYCAALAIHWR